VRDAEGPSRLTVDPAPQRSFKAAPPALLAPSPSPATAAEDDDPRRESRALGIAIKKLRQDHDPRGAMAALDRYSRGFPNGRLAAEGGLVRVEALLALGERGAALRLLDDLPIDESPRARQLLVLRGELRATADRCSDALRDLGRGLSLVPHDAVDERALFARASCLDRLHRPAEARRDLESYRIHFPTGAHAAEVAARLRVQR
jgi:Flp pilus assembly protein TadD